MKQKVDIIQSEPSLISFWSFQEEAGCDREAIGPYAYKLNEMNGPIERVNDGVFGPYAAKMSGDKWLNLRREDCPALNIYGAEAEVTVAAWIKRAPIERRGCEAIAGMWNETNEGRQYCLFLNLAIWDSLDQVCGHISSTGRPTEGYKYCMDASIGQTPVPKDEWQFVAFTYDGQWAKSYLNGELDQREHFNPYYYPYGINNGGETGSNFTVGGVHRSGEMGNWFFGLMGGLAIFNKALPEEKLVEMFERTLKENPKE